MEDPLKSWFWLVLLFVGIAVLTFVYLNTSQPTRLNGLNEGLEGSLAIIQGNTLVAISPVYIPYTLVYGSLINCFEEKESSGGTRLYGDKGYDCDNVLFPSPYCAFGVLHFWQTTFKEFCIDRYGLGKNIFNPENQKHCADLMVQEGFGFHWSTFDRCKGRE